jgi:hypothetical protein
MADTRSMPSFSSRPSLLNLGRSALTVLEWLVKVIQHFIFLKLLRLRRQRERNFTGQRAVRTFRSLPAGRTQQDNAQQDNAQQDNAQAL